MSDPRICSRCVLPESPPEISLDADGICALCREHERRAGSPSAPLQETDLTRILQKHQGRHEFDCLVMCSGGKDSTAALYYAKRRYHLNALAFTFDQGFETEEAMANACRAARKLDAPHLSYRSTFMHDMFARVLRSDSPAVLCHLCAIWYMDLTFRMAERFDAPIIIAGWTLAQMSTRTDPSPGACEAPAPEYARMARATKEFLETLRDDPKYKDFPNSMEEVVSRAQKRRKTLVLSPHWFLPYEPDEYRAVIERELGWTPARLSYPADTTNCRLNFLSVDRALKAHGFTHYHVEMSRLIREGQMTRQEALDRLRVRFDKDFLDDIVRRLPGPP
jgi:hypothetical protein